MGDVWVARERSERGKGAPLKHSCVRDVEGAAAGRSAQHRNAVEPAASPARMRRSGASVASADGPKTGHARKFEHQK